MVTSVFTTRPFQSKPLTHSPASIPRVVILGAGFAGFQVAQQLSNCNVDIVLIDRNNHHTFQPLLHQVATGELGPEQVSTPIRSLLRSSFNISFVMAEVLSIDAIAQWVNTSQGQCRYDSLVITTGGRPRLTNIQGAERYAMPLKTLDQAIAIKRQILNCFERAAATSDPLLKKALLTFTIVGGGATGVEMAGALMDWINHSLVKDYGMIRCSQIRVIVVHSRPHLLPGFRRKLQTYGQRYLQRAGVELKLNQRVQQVSAQGVQLASGDFISSKTVVWTTGIQGNYPPLLSPLTVLEEAPLLQSSLNLTQFPQVYMAGDAVASLLGQAAWPQLAAVAVQQGNTIAGNILRHYRGQALRPFRYQPRGSMAILGHHAAVMQFGSLSLTGGFAWLLWLLVHLILLRGHSQRSSTLICWLRSQYFRERSSQIAPSIT